MDKRKADVFMSMVLIALSAYILLGKDLVEGGLESDLGSLFLPRAVAVIMAVLALNIGIKAIRGLSKNKQTTLDQFIDLNGFSGVFMYVGILFFYWLAMPYIGFMLSTFISMMLVALLLGGKGWFKIVIMVVLVTVLINYGAKEFLRMYLPTGEWF